MRSLTTGEISLAFRFAITTAEESELETAQRGGRNDPGDRGGAEPVQPTAPPSEEPRNC
jgi:hypothetical protein